MGIFCTKKLGLGHLSIAKHSWNSKPLLERSVLRDCSPSEVGHALNSQVVTDLDCKENCVPFSFAPQGHTFPHATLEHVIPSIPCRVAHAVRGDLVQCVSNKTI